MKISSQAEVLHGTHRADSMHKPRAQLTQKCEEVDRDIKRRTRENKELLWRTYKQKPPTQRERRIPGIPDGLTNQGERGIKARMLSPGGLALFPPLLRARESLRMRFPFCSSPKTRSSSLSAAKTPCGFQSSGERGCSLTETTNVPQSRSHILMSRGEWRSFPRSSKVCKRCRTPSTS